MWICNPHSRVMMQTRQPANDLHEIVFDEEDDSRKEKSDVADVINEIPKLRFVACSMLCKVITVV